MSQVSRIALRRCSQNVLVFVFVFVIVFVFVFVFVNFFGHVMFSHHSEQMSQRSQVSRIALRRCSQNVFVFVIFFGHVMSFHHSDQMSQRSQVSLESVYVCQNEKVTHSLLLLTIQSDPRDL